MVKKANQPTLPHCYKAPALRLLPLRSEDSFLTSIKIPDIQEEEEDW